VSKPSWLSVTGTPVSSLLTNRTSEDGVEVRPTPGRGWGVFALREHCPGDVVLIGAGLRLLPRNSIHAVQVAPDTFAYEEGIGSLVNHSCDPNCWPRITERGTYDLVTHRTIRPGDELTVDYAMRNYVIEFFPIRCCCRALNCRRYVTGWQGLSQIQRDRCAYWAAPYLQQLSQAASGRLVVPAQPCEAVRARPSRY
jgi:hypothetical protein